MNKIKKNQKRRPTYRIQSELRNHTKFDYSVDSLEMTGALGMFLLQYTDILSNLSL